MLPTLLDSTPSPTALPLPLLSDTLVPTLPPVDPLVLLPSDKPLLPKLHSLPPLPPCAPPTLQ